MPKQVKVQISSHSRQTLPDIILEQTSMETVRSIKLVDPKIMFKDLWMIGNQEDQLRQGSYQQEVNTPI